MELAQSIKKKPSYECYATGRNSSAILVNFLQLVIAAWQLHKLVRWDWHSLGGS